MHEPRRVVIALPRLGRWLEGFTERNGAVSAYSPTAEGLLLRTDRGGEALLHGAWHGPAPSSNEPIVAWAAGADRTVAVVLVRRGGYSIAAVELSGLDHSVRASKTDQVYVQGRTAAGGQSQQRFARRRAGQAQQLVRSAADTAVRVLLTKQPVEYAELITGGDLPLLEELLGDPRLRVLGALPRQHVAVGEPRRRTVDEAVDAARSVPIDVTNALPQAPR
ncbi:hypothetical protein EK0264_17385 [Epidermidibacterium keratini]|uniref:Actinobacteria/chloroflexi VLRF1 release factor domain-containing protein n=1 Tax=Epidermidibacterium keratini TaxID=1891644 RepID=A0A7L4YS47_9ACTN|nr:acVLRF1 family peptidyl-tRNA hydrolase [Epidermidibacterium keratini]QHC01878.1 hypothetical protein EK0264_17385 [Epidermidibacterium keratini]